MKSIDRIAVVCAILTIVPSLVYGSGTIRYENVADIDRLFSGSDLVVFAEIQAVDIECRDFRGADAFITLKVIEVWYGACDLEITVRAVLVKPTPEMSCGGSYDKSKPSRLEPGDKYLFLCSSLYDVKTKEYVEGYKVPVGGILSYEENQGDIWYNEGGGLQIDVNGAANFARSYLLETEPSSLYRESDLVIIAKGVDVQGGDQAGAGDGGTFMLTDATSASVVEVLKGEYSDDTIRFSADLFSLAPMRPRVKTGDTVMLFLKKLDGEYGLVRGVKGLAILESGRILNSSRKPTGELLDVDRKIVRGVDR